VAELSVTVRAHGAAAVQVRIDERAQRFIALKPRVKLDSKFARELQVRPLARGADDFVDAFEPQLLALGIHPDDAELVSLLLDACDSQSCVEGHGAGVAKSTQGAAKRPSRAERIRIPSAKDPGEHRRANRPDQLSGRDFCGKLSKCQQRVGG
jgi:hypothetical protein